MTWTRDIVRSADNWKSDELEDRPNRTGSPLPGRSIEGTALRGARWDKVEMHEAVR